MAYSTTSFAEIKSNLGAKILPFFQAGQLALKDEADAQLHPQSSAIHLEELPRPTFFETMTQPPRQIKYLNSPRLNFRKDLIGNTAFPKALKQAEYYINDCIEIPVANLKYHRIHKVLTQGFLSKKVYAAIGSTQPICITFGGKTLPVATMDTRVYLPESVCRELERKYVGKYPEDTILRLTVTGPASLGGGYDQGVFMNFYCLDYFLEIYADSYHIAVVD